MIMGLHFSPDGGILMGFVWRLYEPIARTTYIGYIFYRRDTTWHLEKKRRD